MLVDINTTTKKYFTSAFDDVKDKKYDLRVCQCKEYFLVEKSFEKDGVTKTESIKLKAIDGNLYAIVFDKTEEKKEIAKELLSYNWWSKKEIAKFVEVRKATLEIWIASYFA